MRAQQRCWASAVDKNILNLVLMNGAEYRMSVDECNIDTF